MAKSNQPHNQQMMFDTEPRGTRDSGPVTCLGMTLPDDDARREDFLGILREKLKDPEFRKIEVFATGSDEDILALSDAAYYTECPKSVPCRIHRALRQAVRSECAVQARAVRC